MTTPLVDSKYQTPELNRETTPFEEARYAKFPSVWLKCIIPFVFVLDLLVNPIEPPEVIYFGVDSSYLYYL